MYITFNLKYRIQLHIIKRLILMKLLKHITLAVLATLPAMAYAANDPVGLWRTIDDKTGFSKSVVEIKKEDNGTYTGTIIEVNPRPGYTPKETCFKCPAPYTDKPIVGLSILRNMKENPNKPGEFSGGTVIDPLIGKVYKSQMKINTTGNKLTVRGFIGVSIIGRSQTWIRQTP